MHMADALLSPAVGGIMWLVSAGTIAYCSHRVREESDDRTIPLMGVLGAFIFAAQMINFSIPATGSSGHLGGGLLLTILLGPWAAFLVISSVLVVQALFFADGGLLALGCNIFNLGFIPAFIVFPLIYLKILGKEPDRSRRSVAVMVSALVGLQLGPFSVVLETWLSGVSALPFTTFLLLMQPIHLGIGLMEGIVTIAVVTFIHQARPELLGILPKTASRNSFPLSALIVTFLATALLTGGVLSRFASRNPDGLEWAIAGVTKEKGVKGPELGVHGTLASLQEKTALLPDYSFSKPAEAKSAPPNPAGGERKESRERVGAGSAGVLGSLLTLALLFVTGLLLKKRITPPSCKASEDGLP